MSIKKQNFKSVEKLRKILCDKVINKKVAENGVFLLLLLCAKVFGL